MNEKHTSNTLKKIVVNITENTHYNPNFANRIKSDASRAGSDAFVYWKLFFVITDYGTWLSILKKHWSNKSYNSRHTRWVDRLLPFDFNSEHIPDAKRGLVDYISRQPNQKGKDTNNYDEEFAVATITRIHDAIAAIYVNSAPKLCQSQLLNALKNTFFSRASNIYQTNHSKFFTSLNHRTIQLLFSNPANAAFFQVTNSSNMTTSIITPEALLHQLHVSPFSRLPILRSIPPGHQMKGQRHPT